MADAVMPAAVSARAALGAGEPMCAACRSRGGGSVQQLVSLLRGAAAKSGAEPASS